jgi:uncharacterized protein YkwD
MAWLLLLTLLAALGAACEETECLDGAFGGQCEERRLGHSAGEDAADDGVSDVLDDTTDEATTPTEGEYPPSAGKKQIEALGYVNDYRWMVGLPPVDELESINKAAQAHAFFYCTHADKYQSTGLSPHDENKDFGEGFTGVSFFDRMLAARVRSDRVRSPGRFTGVSFFDRMLEQGYSGMGGFEVIAFYNSPRKAVDGWMETLYHRIPIIHHDSGEMGYGSACGGPNAIDVIDFGIPANHKYPVRSDLIILYPYDGQVDVPISWDGLESPQPPIPPGGYPSGPIVTATFVASMPQIEKHQILDPQATEIEHTWLTPGSDQHLSGTETVSLYPHAPLKADTTYRVRFTGNRDGTKWELLWSFTTSPAPSY